MRKKKSAKQLLREQQAAREVRQAEVDAEYELMAKNWRDAGLEHTSPVPEKDEWIGRKQEEWERQQPLIITGKYNDKEKIDANYKQNFVEYIRRLCPEVIEELRAFVPFFDELFGENKDKYLALFDWYKINLFDLNQSLDDYINSFNPYFPFFEFRPYNNGKFRYDYKWGENRVLLNFLYWIFSSAKKNLRMKFYKIP